MTTILTQGADDQNDNGNEYQKLTSSKLAKKHGISTKDLLAKFVEVGYLEMKGDKHYITEAGKTAGGEFRVSKKFGPYFIWPESMKV